MTLETDFRQSEDRGFKKGIFFIILGVVLFFGLAIGIRYVGSIKSERDQILLQMGNLKEENQLLEDRLTSMKLYEEEYKKTIKNLRAENEKLKQELAVSKKAKSPPKKTTTTKKTIKRK